MPTQITNLSHMNQKGKRTRANKDLMGHGSNNVKLGQGKFLKHCVKGNDQFKSCVFSNYEAFKRLKYIYKRYKIHI